MCKYCHAYDGNAKIFKDNNNLIEIIRRPIFDVELYALRVRMLEPQIGIVANINYCPMCRKKAR